MNDCSNCESYYHDIEATTGFPWWFSGKASAFQGRGHGFDPWSGMILPAAEQLGPCATTFDTTIPLVPQTPGAATTEAQEFQSPCCTAARKATTMRCPHTAARQWAAHCSWRVAPVHLNYRKTCTVMETQHSKQK